MGIYIFTEEKIVKRGIGNFLWNCIEEKKIKKKELCKGLCSQSELSKIKQKSATKNSCKILKKAEKNISINEFIKQAVSNYLKTC